MYASPKGKLLCATHSKFVSRSMYREVMTMAKAFLVGNNLMRESPKRKQSLVTSVLSPRWSRHSSAPSPSGNHDHKKLSHFGNNHHNNRQRQPPLTNEQGNRDPKLPKRLRKFTMPSNCAKNKIHATAGIRWSSPTQLLICRSVAYVWQSGRDAQFSTVYGRMYQSPCK